MSVIQVTTLIYNDIIKVQDLIDLKLAGSRFIPNILPRIEIDFESFHRMNKYNDKTILLLFC